MEFLIHTTNKGIIKSKNLFICLEYIGEQKIYFYFFKRPECYNQELLSHFHLFTIAIYGRNCFDMQH